MAPVAGVSVENDQRGGEAPRPMPSKETQAVRRGKVHGMDPAIFWVRGQRNVGGIWEILQFALEQVDKAGENQVKHRQISNQTPVEITEKHDQILETLDEGGAGGGY